MQFEQALFRRQTQYPGYVIEHMRAAARPQSEYSLQLKTRTVHQTLQRFPAWAGSATLNTGNDGLRCARAPRQIALREPGTAPGGDQQS